MTVTLLTGASSGIGRSLALRLSDDPLALVARRKALLDTYPNLASMHLVDYKVRVINSAEGTAARVRVVIESADSHDVWSTIGVSENIIEASWLALVDAVEYKLFKDEGQIAGCGQ